MIQRQEKDVLTVSSLSTASKRVSLKWLTLSIWKDPLLNRISRGQVKNPEMASPVTSARIQRDAQDHVKV